MNENGSDEDSKRFTSEHVCALMQPHPICSTRGDAIHRIISIHAPETSGAIVSVDYNFKHRIHTPGAAEEHRALFRNRSGQDG